MSDDHDVSPAADEPESASDNGSDAQGAREADNIQSLTDFFDQMDRAAFRRALANRDAQSASIIPQRYQRRR